MILIKNVEMPTNCYKCPMRRRDGMDLVCPIAHERFSVADVNILEYRHKNCPLAPVPPHGRLIDADALMKQVEHDTPLSDVFEKTMRRYLHNAPPVIPAEEGEA